MKLPRKRNEEQQCEYIWFPLDILFTPFGMVLDFFFGNITSISIVWLELNSMFLLFFKLGRKVFGFFSNSRTNDRHLCRRVHVAYSIEPAARMSRMVEFSSFVKLLHFPSKCIQILLRCLIFFLFHLIVCVCGQYVIFLLREILIYFHWISHTLFIKAETCHHKEYKIN